MRFMMIVKSDKDYEAGLPLKPELIAAIGKFTSEMVKAGVLLETGGLEAPECGYPVGSSP